MNGIFSQAEGVAAAAAAALRTRSVDAIAADLAAAASVIARPAATDGTCNQLESHVAIERIRYHIIPQCKQQRHSSLDPPKLLPFCDKRGPAECMSYDGAGAIRMKPDITPLW